MWGIKKWPGRILQGVLAAGQVANAGAVFYPPLIPVALGLGLAQVVVGAIQHKSKESGEVIKEDENSHNDSPQFDER